MTKNELTGKNLSKVITLVMLTIKLKENFIQILKKLNLKAIS